MSTRSIQPTMKPARARGATRRGIAPITEIEPDDELTAIDTTPMNRALEPAVSGRATRRDLPARDLPPPPSGARQNTPRGEYSIASVRGIQSDVVSGSIETSEVGAPSRGVRRRDVTTPTAASVRLAQATRTEITVVIAGQPLTLDRPNAVALAQLILTAFG